MGRPSGRSGSRLVCSFVLGKEQKGVGSSNRCKRQVAKSQTIRARCGRDDRYIRSISRAVSPGGFERDRARRVTKVDYTAKGPVMVAKGGAVRTRKTRARCGRIDGYIQASRVPSRLEDSSVIGLGGDINSLWSRRLGHLACRLACRLSAEHRYQSMASR
jgi:hypothetical protein